MNQKQFYYQTRCAKERVKNLWAIKTTITKQLFPNLSFNKHFLLGSFCFSIYKSNTRQMKLRETGISQLGDVNWGSLPGGHVSNFYSKSLIRLWLCNSTSENAPSHRL